MKEITEKQNWYILYTQTDRQNKVCEALCQEGLHAFLPVMEFYRRDRKELDKKPMFPGYIFVRSNKEQEEFDLSLKSIEEKSWDYIKQLKEDGRTALTEEEKNFFENLLDEAGVAKMSYGY